MKRKSPRGIPDFSRKPGTTKSGTPGDAAASKTSGKQGARPPIVKPQATSSKSGQRGQ